MIFPGGDTMFLKFGDRRRVASELKIGDIVERHLDGAGGGAGWWSKGARGALTCREFEGYELLGVQELGWPFRGGASGGEAGR